MTKSVKITIVAAGAAHQASRRSVVPNLAAGGALVDVSIAFLEFIG